MLDQIKKLAAHFFPLAERLARTSAFLFFPHSSHFLYLRFLASTMVSVSRNSSAMDVTLEARRHVLTAVIFHVLGKLHTENKA